MHSYSIKGVDKYRNDQAGLSLWVDESHEIAQSKLVIILELLRSNGDIIIQNKSSFSIQITGRN